MVEHAFNPCELVEKPHLFEITRSGVGRKIPSHCQKYVTNQFLPPSGNLGIDKWPISALIQNVAKYYPVTYLGILVCIYPG